MTIELKIRGTCDVSGHTTTIECYLYKDGSYVDVGTMTFDNASTVQTLDVTAVLTSTLDINSTRLRLILNTTAPEGIYLYQAKLVVNDADYYVNNYTEVVRDAWITLHGSTPYIGDQILTPATSWVYAISANQEIYYWTFETVDFIGGPYITLGTINTFFQEPLEVEFGIYCVNINAGSAVVQVYLWANGIWNDAGDITIDWGPLTGLLWKTLDVTSILDTVDKINATRVKFVIADTTSCPTIVIAQIIVNSTDSVFVGGFVNDVVSGSVQFYGGSPYLNNSLGNFIWYSADTNQTCSYFTFDQYLPYGETIGPLNLPYARMSDNIQTIIENTVTNAFVPWEWWIDYNGAFQFDDQRGSTKSITLTAANEIGGSIKESSSKQTAQRVKVTGSGESATQDLNTSDWEEDTSAMQTIGSFYETIVSDKTISHKEVSEFWAKIILAQSAALREEVTVRLENDPYTTNDFDVGDTVTVYDPATNLTGQYRIKTIEKRVNGNSGETSILTCSYNRTDITDRLSNIYKTIQRLLGSSAYMDMFMGEGGGQTKVDVDKMTDIWGQNASNKWAIELPDSETADPGDFVETCKYVGHTPTAVWEMSKEEFYVTASAVDAAVSVWVNEPTLQYSRNPRFKAEIVVSEIDGDPWQDDDIMEFGIHQIDNCSPPSTIGFGFWINHENGEYVLECFAWDSIGGQNVSVAVISPNIKYEVEARMEWPEKVIKFYFGKPDVDETDPLWGFRLRAILPISLGCADSDALSPCWVMLNAESGATKPWLYINKWETQAIASIMT